MIFWKWNTDYFFQDYLNMEANITSANTTEQVCYVYLFALVLLFQLGTSEVPLLLNELIFMFLPQNGVSIPLYPGQKIVEKYVDSLLIIMIVNMNKGPHCARIHLCASDDVCQAPRATLPPQKAPAVHVHPIYHCHLADLIPLSNDLYIDLSYALTQQGGRCQRGRVERR